MTQLAVTNTCQASNHTAVSTEHIQLQYIPISFNNIWLIFRTSNRSSAIRRLAWPILSIMSGCSMNRSIAAASASASRTGTTRKPFSPSITVSRQPGASVVITGRAMACASQRRTSGTCPGYIEIPSYPLFHHTSLAFSSIPFIQIRYMNFHKLKCHQFYFFTRKVLSKA